MNNAQASEAGQVGMPEEHIDPRDAMPEQAVTLQPVPGRAQVKCILEGALLASGETLNVERLGGLFEEYERPQQSVIRELLEEIATEYAGRGIELKEVASGFRIQVRQEIGPWVSRLWTEKPPRYSRALLETLALIAYRQPITRGEIEEIRGVTVSSEMIKSLLERDWVRVVGHRDVPGRPALYATTNDFLDYFDLKSLDELPTLSEIRDLDKANAELELEIGPAAAILAAEQSAARDANLEHSTGEPQGSLTQQYVIGGDAEEDDLDIKIDMHDIDEVLKRVEDSFRRKEDPASAQGDMPAADDQSQYRP
ncbi:MAG: SMC-Scp complex subunit ScpB [Pseudomonadota bacterium]